MIRDSNEFLALLRAARKRLGAKDSGIMESMATMDSSDTTRYDVVMIPRKPKPRDRTPLQPKRETHVTSKVENDSLLHRIIRRFREEIKRLLDAHSRFLYVVVAVLLWRIVYALMQS